MFLIFFSHVNTQVKSTTQVNHNQCTTKKTATAIDTQPTQLLSYKPMKVKKREVIKQCIEGCAKMVVQVVYQAYCYRFHTCAEAVYYLCLNPLMRCFSFLRCSNRLQFRT